MLRNQGYLKLLCRKQLGAIYEKCRYAGHSKWQNIRHIKAANDGKRAILFAKLARNIRIAIEEGKNADPVINIKLSQAIQEAKKANMPVANITSILKLAKDEGGRNEYFNIEIAGPGGCALIVTVRTANSQIFRTNLNSALRKFKGSFAKENVAFLFECKGVIETDIPFNSSLDDAVVLAVDLDIEDVITVDETKVLQFICDKSLMNKIKTQLQLRKYNVHSAEIRFNPSSLVKLQDPDRELVKVLIEKLEEMPDVENVFDNVEWPDNV